MDWNQALWYREDGEDDVARRFEAAGLSAQDVDQLLARFAAGATYWEREQEKIPARVRVLLAIELDVLGDVVRQEAAAMRADGIHEMAAETSIADIARDVGLTRQAASKSANAFPLRSGSTGARVARALGDITRTISRGAKDSW
ncbi:hypothetical protein ACIPY5_20050 [Microbacterium sp. NPDC089698]|uniref:hypothetical protein n=1 Tax=Microbacterium sp. NPDC089698 TaxID=3364200 RepID=UPI00381043DC